MEVYVNGVWDFTIQVLTTTTVKDIKENMQRWLDRRGINDYTIKIIFGDGVTVVPETVFQTNQYDMVDFQSYADILPGSSLYIEYVHEEQLEDQPVTHILQTTVNEPPPQVWSILIDTNAAHYAETDSVYRSEDGARNGFKRVLRDYLFDTNRNQQDLDEDWFENQANIFINKKVYDTKRGRLYLLSIAKLFD